MHVPKTQALLNDASTVGCSGTASHEILDLRVVEDAHARLTWTVRLVIHDEVLEPLLLRSAERLTADFELQPTLSVDIREGGAVETLGAQDVDPDLWNVTVPTIKHKRPDRDCVLKVLVDQR